MFCAAIPAAAATGVALNNKQVQQLRLAQESNEPTAKPRPILKIAAGVVTLLLIGSITYHTLRFSP